MGAAKKSRNGPQSTYTTSRASRRNESKPADVNLTGSPGQHQQRLQQTRADEHKLTSVVVGRGGLHGDEPLGLDSTKPGYDSQGAAYYICIVILVYALSLFLFVVSLLKRRNRDKLQQFGRNSDCNGGSLKHNNNNNNNNTLTTISNREAYCPGGLGVVEDRVSTVFREDSMTNRRDGRDTRRYRPLRKDSSAPKSSSGALDLSVSSSDSRIDRMQLPPLSERLHVRKTSSPGSVQNSTSSALARHPHSYQNLRSVNSSVVSPGGDLVTRRSSHSANTNLVHDSSDNLTVQGGSLHKDGRQRFVERADGYAIVQGPSAKSAKAERLARSPDELITLVQVLPSEDENEGDDNAVDCARIMSGKKQSRNSSKDEIDHIDGSNNSNQAPSRDHNNRCRWSIGADGNIWILQLDAAMSSANDANIPYDNTASLPKHSTRATAAIEKNCFNDTPKLERDSDFIENNSLTIRQSASTDQVLSKFPNLQLQQQTLPYKSSLNKHDSETDLHILSPSSDDGKRRRFSLAKSVETAQIDVDDCFNGADNVRCKKVVSLSDKKCAHWLSDDVWFSDEGPSTCKGQSCGQQDVLRYGAGLTAGSFASVDRRAPGWRVTTPKSPEEVLRLIHVTSV